MHSANESTAIPSKHALIIEDEVIIALEVEALLSDLGYLTCDIAASPSEALACATRRRPDLITADYRIVGGTGVEAVSAIVAALGNIPVVFVTGNAEAVAPLTRAPIVDKPIAARSLALACENACRA
jgi:CheY-like chemotaxis protein